MRGRYGDEGSALRRRPTATAGEDPRTVSAWPIKGRRNGRGHQHGGGQAERTNREARGIVVGLVSDPGAPLLRPPIGVSSPACLARPETKKSTGLTQELHRLETSPYGVSSFVSNSLSAVERVGRGHRGRPVCAQRVHGTACSSCRASLGEHHAGTVPGAAKVEEPSGHLGKGDPGVKSSRRRSSREQGT